MEIIFRIFSISKYQKYHILEEMKKPNNQNFFEERKKEYDKNYSSLKKIILFIFSFLISMNLILIQIIPYDYKHSSSTIKHIGSNLMTLTFIFLLGFYLFKLVCLKLDLNNEENLKNCFLKYCRNILILEDILKMLVKNPFYKVEKYKVDVNSIMTIFKGFIDNIEKLDRLSFPQVMLDFSLFETLNLHKAEFFKYYLEKKKVVFDVIFKIYEDNNDNKYYTSIASLYKLYKLSDAVSWLNFQTENFNGYMKKDIKDNIDDKFQKYDYSNYQQNSSDDDYEKYIKGDYISKDFLKNLENNSSLIEKMSDNFKNDLEINAKYFNFLKNFFDFVDFNHKQIITSQENPLNSNNKDYEKDKKDVNPSEIKNEDIIQCIIPNKDKFLAQFKLHEKNLKDIIEAKQNSLYIAKQIKNIFLDKYQYLEDSLEKNELNTDNNEKDEGKIKLENFLANRNNFIGNNFEFSAYHKSDYNELEINRISDEKMQSFQVSLMDIFKGEQETKPLRMNLLYELEDVQKENLKKAQGEIEIN